MTRKKSARPQEFPAPVSCIDLGSTDKGGRLEGIAALSPRQQSALSVVAFSPSLNQAATNSGIGKTTLRRWMNDPAFRDEVIRTRREAAELASHEIRGMTLRAVSVINMAMDHPDPVISLRAARYALSFGGRNMDVQMLATELDDLKSSLNLGATG